jgi:uncharacterized membrane protein
MRRVVQALLYEAIAIAVVAPLPAFGFARAFFVRMGGLA